MARPQVSPRPLQSLPKVVMARLLSGMFATDEIPSEDHLLTFHHRMGELEPWIDENFIRNLWFQMGEQVNVKMIRDKFSG
jgi:hypothetical protein